MLFSSITFLYFFLPITLLLYYCLPKKARNYVLLASSIVFYAFGEPHYIYLLLGSCIVGWLHGLLFLKFPNNKYVLLSGICINLAFLAYFKYADFGIRTTNAVLHTNIPLLYITLPIGISFFTFQNMSYIIDVYRGTYQAQRNLFTYSTYLCLFPQLIAGPIVRYSDVEKELQHRSITLQNVSDGCVIFIVGLGKKVLLANTLGVLATTSLLETTLVMTWLQAIAFTLQIYFDFSGYSDMAIGMGLMLGFHFPKNFDYPLCSTSITEFWRTWHITLGSWFKDYVYIPLKGNRCKTITWIRNVLIVWMLTGIWHGASWNFVLWGVFYGVLLLLEKLFLHKYLTEGFMSHLYVILITVLGFVIFNSNSLQEIQMTYANMFTLQHVSFCNIETLYYLKSYAVLVILAIVGCTKVPKKIAEAINATKYATILQPVFVFFILTLCTSCLVNGSFNPFLYFRF